MAGQWQTIPEVSQKLNDLVAALQQAGYDTRVEPNVFVEGGSLSWNAKDKRYPDGTPSKIGGE